MYLFLFSTRFLCSPYKFRVQPDQAGSTSCEATMVSGRLTLASSHVLRMNACVMLSRVCTRGDLRWVSQPSESHQMASELCKGICQASSTAKAKEHYELRNSFPCNPHFSPCVTFISRKIEHILKHLDEKLPLFCVRRR